MTTPTTALAGCSSGGNGDSRSDRDRIALADRSAGERTRQSLRLTVGEALADSEWQPVSTTYPRGRFTVQSAKHENLGLGVDVSGDGTADEEFGADDVSGVNNEFSFTVELDTGDTLAEGDAVLVEYPAVDTPSEPGEYEVETATATVAVE